MANVAIPNGVFVHRAWKSLPDTELMAVFQYEHEAREWAAGNIASQNEGCLYVVTNTYDGKQWLIHQPQPEPSP